jgi:hypothetical protein
MSHNTYDPKAPNTTKLRGLTVGLRQLGNYFGERCVFAKMKHHNVIIQKLTVQNQGDYANIIVEFMNGEKEELVQPLLTEVDKFIFERICFRAFGQEVTFAGIFDGFGLSVDSRSITHDALLFDGWKHEV